MIQTYLEMMRQGNELCRRGDYRCACPCYAEAAIIAQQSRDAGRELEAREKLVVWKANTGRWDETAEDARRLGEKARALHADARIADSTLAHALVCSDLRRAEALEVLDVRNHWPEIEQLLSRALDAARGRQDSFHQCYCLMELGGCAARVGRYKEARKWLDEAESLLGHQLGSQEYFLFNISCYKSILARYLGEHDQAIDFARRGLQAAQSGGNPQYIAYARLILARALHAQKNFHNALSLLEQVHSEAMKCGWMQEEQQSGFSMAEVLTNLQRLDQAESTARRALELAEELSFREDQVKCLVCLGRILLIRENHGEASTVLEDARLLARRRHYPDHLETAKELMRAVKRSFVGEGK